MGLTTSALHLSEAQHTRAAVLVAALGYFVDVYDLVLFSIVRIPSLISLGLSGDALLSEGVLLLNCQMAGMLLGGVLWGIWGDKRGRIQVLFGSILLYSIANLLNAVVQTVPQYAVLRFFAGVGLAGEIGAGITLVSELMTKESRGWGTTIVATVGVSGAVAAGLMGDFFEWRTAYVVGGVMGLMLLVLRVSVHESGMFAAAKTRQSVARGDLTMLFRSKDRFVRYLSCVLVGTPTWYVVGVLVTFAPELGAALDLNDPPQAAKAVLYCYVGITLGDLASGALSQIWKSRKKAIALFLLATFAVGIYLLTHRGGTPEQYYFLCACLGFFVGYWAVFVTTAAEQFGTNLRATVATTVPNLVRGATVLMTSLFNSLKPTIGIVYSAQLVGVIVFCLAMASLLTLKETYGKDLDYVEE